MVLVSGISLPLTQITFCIPWLMGPKFTEHFHATDAFALALALAGFGVYQFFSREGRAALNTFGAPVGQRKDSLDNPSFDNPS
jgi:hypothetical protein